MVPIKRNYLVRPRRPERLESHASRGVRETGAAWSRLIEIIGRSMVWAIPALRGHQASAIGAGRDRAPAGIARRPGSRAGRDQAPATR
jgi:hypothetical protein